MFEQGHHDDLSVIEKLIREGKNSEAEPMTHTLKGLCGNIGATSLFDKLQHIDMLLKTSQTPPSETITQTHREFDTLIGEIRAFYTTYQETLDNVSSSHDENDLKGLLITMKEHLESDMGIVFDTFTHIKALKNTPLKADELTALQNALDRFDTDDQKEILNRLILQSNDHNRGNSR